MMEAQSWRYHMDNNDVAVSFGNMPSSTAALSMAPPALPGHLKSEQHAAGWSAAASSCHPSYYASGNLENVYGHLAHAQQQQHQTQTHGYHAAGGSQVSASPVKNGSSSSRVMAHSRDASLSHAMPSPSQSQQSQQRASRPSTYLQQLQVHQQQQASTTGLDLAPADPGHASNPGPPSHSDASSDALLSSRESDARTARLSAGTAALLQHSHCGHAMNDMPLLTSITTAPFYAAPGQALIINAQGHPQRVSLNASFSGTFFLSDAESVICYRRNMFQVKAALVAPSLDVCKYYVRDDSTGYAHLIGNYKIQLLPTNYADGSKIDLVSKPNHALLSDGDLSILTKGENCSSIGEERLDFRRLLFRYATQNNGRRVELRQYYQLLLVVYAQTLSGLEVPVLAAFTRPIAVRGRNPAFYEDKILPAAALRQRRRRKQQFLARRNSRDESAREEDFQDNDDEEADLTASPELNASAMNTGDRTNAQRHDSLQPAEYSPTSQSAQHGNFETTQSEASQQMQHRRYSLIRETARESPKQSSSSRTQQHNSTQSADTPQSASNYADAAGQQSNYTTQPSSQQNDAASQQPQLPQLSQLAQLAQLSQLSSQQQQQHQHQQQTASSDGLFNLNGSLMHAPILSMPGAFAAVEEKAQ
jgi:hypothetical protein